MGRNGGDEPPLFIALRCDRATRRNLGESPQASRRLDHHHAEHGKPSPRKATTPLHREHRATELIPAQSRHCE